MLRNGATDEPRHSARLPWGTAPAKGYLLVKGILDFVLALALLVLTSPLFLLAALLVKLTSRGPVLYCQTRLGKDGRPYTIYKIRSMRHNCELQSGARWSMAGDPRVTLVGQFLRRTHLDELPQLFNVLLGDMSLVGPRPERPEFVPGLEEAIPRYRERLRVRPGITGLAQVQLPPDTDLASVRRKLAHDLHYLERVGLWLDLCILFSTIFHVLGLPHAPARLFVPGGSAVESAYELSVAEPIAEKVNDEAAPTPELQPA